MLAIFIAESLAEGASTRRLISGPRNLILTNRRGQNVSRRMYASSTLLPRRTGVGFDAFVERRAQHMYRTRVSPETRTISAGRFRAS